MVSVYSLGLFNSSLFAEERPIKEVVSDFGNESEKEVFILKQFEQRQKWATLLNKEVIEEEKNPTLLAGAATGKVKINYKIESSQEIYVKNIHFLKEKALLLNQAENFSTLLDDRMKWKTVQLPVSLKDLKNVSVSIEFETVPGLKPFRSGKKLEILESSLNYFSNESIPNFVFNIEKVEFLNDRYNLEVKIFSENSTEDKM